MLKPNLIKAPEATTERQQEMKEARKSLLKMIVNFSLYVLAGLAVGVLVILSFIWKVMAMPFTEEGRR